MNGATMVNAEPNRDASESTGSSDFRLFRNERGQLVLVDSQGREHVDVTAVRGFPISDPDFGISLCDDDGKELIWVRRLSELATELREIVEEELAQREFLPVILRIVSISANSEPCEWLVDTDRGRTTFLLKTDEDVRRLDERRAMIIDGNGVSYLIADLIALDRLSQRYLERYL